MPEDFDIQEIAKLASIELNKNELKRLQWSYSRLY